MDPNATMALIRGLVALIEARGAGDPDSAEDLGELIAARNDLGAWINDGGFEPTWESESERNIQLAWSVEQRRRFLARLELIRQAADELDY